MFYSMSEWILGLCVALILRCLLEMVVIVFLFSLANWIVQIQRLLRWENEKEF